MDIEWRDVVGYEGFYMVSRCGLIKSLGKSYTMKDGRTSRKPAKVLRQNTDKKGYKSIRLCKDGDQSIFKVHRLVANAFIGPAPETNSQVNHKNGSKDFNHASNLEWVTPKGNMQHAVKNGLFKSNKGERNPRCILSESNVIDIIRISKTGLSCAAISRLAGVSEATIRQIQKGRNWSWLTDPQSHAQPD